MQKKKGSYKFRTNERKISGYFIKLEKRNKVMSNQNDTIIVERFKKFYNHLTVKNNEYSFIELIDLFINSNQFKNTNNIREIIERAYEHINFNTKIQLKFLNGYVNERRFLV